MPIDFAQLQQKLNDQLQSQLAEQTSPQQGAGTDEVAQFQNLMDGSDQGGAAIQNPGAGNPAQTDPATAPTFNAVDAVNATPGDVILNHLSSMSSEFQQIQQVAAKAQAEGGDAGNSLRMQIDVAKIVETAGAATDGVNKTSQGTDSLLKA